MKASKYLGCSGEWTKRVYWVSSLRTLSPNTKISWGIAKLLLFLSVTMPAWLEVYIYIYIIIIFIVSTIISRPPSAWRLSPFHVPRTTFLPKGALAPHWSMPMGPGDEGKTGSRALLNAGYLQQLKPNSLYSKALPFQRWTTCLLCSKTAMIGWVYENSIVADGKPFWPIDAMNNSLSGSSAGMTELFTIYGYSALFVEFASRMIFPNIYTVYIYIYIYVHCFLTSSVRTLTSDF